MGSTQMYNGDNGKQAVKKAPLQLTCIIYGYKHQTKTYYCFIDELY